MNILVKVIKNIAVAFMILCILVEISIRLLPPFFPEPQRSEIKNMGLSIHSALHHYYGGDDGSARIILLPKKEKKDILVVGDSFPAGSRIRSGYHFPSLIQKMTGKNVINLSVIATGPVQYNRMVEVGMQFSPDLVIYCLFANDFRYGTNDVDIKKLSQDNIDFRYLSDSALFTDCITARQRILFYKDRLEDFSLFIRTAKTLVTVSKLPPIMKDTADHKDRYFEINGAYFHFNSKQFWDRFISWSNEDVLKGFQTTLNLVKEAHSFVTKGKRSFFVIMIPSKEMVYGQVTKENKLFYDDSHIKTYNEFEAKMNDYNIPVFNSIDFFVSQAKKGHSLYFPIDGHFNENGHQKMAEAIFRLIQN